MKSRRRQAVSALKDKKTGRMSLATIVASAFGGLVAVSMLLVLYLAVMANRENTFSLLNDKTVLIVRALKERVESHLEPVGKSVAALKRMFEDGDISGADFNLMRLALSGAILSNPSIDVIVFTDTEQNESGIYQDENGKLWPFRRNPTPEIAQRYVLPKLEPDAPPTWGPLIESQGRVYANVTVPLVRGGKLAGYLTAAVSTDEIGKAVQELDEGSDATVFIITDEDTVISHSDTDDLQAGRKKEIVLPTTIADLADPVLLRLSSTPVMGDFKAAEDAGVDVRRIGDGPEHSNYIAMTATISGYSTEPWLVGEYVRSTSISREVHRLRGSAIIGLGAVLLAFLVAVWLARRSARPLREIAARAEYVGKLDFEQVNPLPRSRIRELDQVSLAFNAMVSGLRAMNTYVPRTLFNKLMRLGFDGASKAREAELTFVFTDISGFTSLSEKMSAVETADVLNAHFRLLVEAAEEEGGTVDKFIGDGMLAFWGAPDARPDHAQAALRACLKMAHAQHKANEEAMRLGKPVLRLRIGVHTGTAVVGNVGAHDRWNYTVVGDAVNTCERLQALGRTVVTEDDTVILASADTLARIPGITGVEPVGEQHLRGREANIEVWRVHSNASWPAEGRIFAQGQRGVA
ncbi:HAMP domain-containing protein [Stappia sp. GBMRC 2046]|uniref:HAMP domain-containing protein n=1 Tax=Stappia sediminis TaxID=2692190 RepID=A0A7X3LV48_9HYPH|nr:adenylate/guanylate cyclase domain-containing protein [Stappia sediminis]MXN65679.1 HAMP domain-containing protein [Stappia sediminis]